VSESLKGKVGVITGAASGIGLATTKAMIEAGVKVFMVDWDEKAVNEKAAELGEKAIPQITNLLDAESCAAMIPEILQKTGQIDILHCNAGTYIGGNLDETDGPTIDRMLNLNVNAVMKNVHDIIPHMKERGVGDIVYVFHYSIYIEIEHTVYGWTVGFIEIATNVGARITM
jgi:ribitol 2-dehydrogenase